MFTKTRVHYSRKTHQTKKLVGKCRNDELKGEATAMRLLRRVASRRRATTLSRGRVKQWRPAARGFRSSLLIFVPPSKWRLWEIWSRARAFLNIRAFPTPVVFPPYWARPAILEGTVTPFSILKPCLRKGSLAEIVRGSWHEGRQNLLVNRAPRTAAVTRHCTPLVARAHPHPR